LSKVTGDLIQSPFILDTGYNFMKIEQEAKSEIVEEIEGIPICGSNFTNPVTNRSQYMCEIHYRIGDRLYIENAD
jgi:hypothetical protein